jgi:hypothetical protein
LNNLKPFNKIRWVYVLILLVIHGLAAFGMASFLVKFSWTSGIFTGYEPGNNQSLKKISEIVAGFYFEHKNDSDRINLSYIDKMGVSQTDLSQIDKDCKYWVVSMSLGYEISMLLTDGHVGLREGWRPEKNAQILVNRAQKDLNEIKKQIRALTR